MTTVILDKIYKNFKPVQFKKGDFLISAGEIEQFLYFLEQGIVRYFYYNPQNGKETTTDFSFSGEFCFQYASYASQTPSQIEMQALTDISAYRIERQVLEEKLQSEPDFLRIKAQVLEKMSLEEFERKIRLLSKTPEENYLYLIEKEPVIMNNIPLKYIASYIGITPQALSRIRKRIVL